MICRICGNEVADGEKVCDFCGSPIKGSSSVENETGPGSANDDFGKTLDNEFNDPFFDVTENQKTKDNEYGKYDEDFRQKDETAEKPLKGYKNDKFAIYVLIGVIALLICVIIVAVAKGGKHKNDNDIIAIEEKSEVQEEEKPDYIKPEKKPVKNNLISIDTIDSIISADANGADISVCVIDIKNDAMYSTANANQAMSASAIVNIPVLYTVHKELLNKNCTWDHPVHFQYKYSGRGKLKKEQSGSNIRLDSITEQMLNYSDNNATNSLIDCFGRDYINSLCNRSSYTSVDIQRYLGESSEYKDNYISARDAAKMLEEMYSSTGGGVNNNFLYKFFSIYDDVRNKGVGRNLPNGVTFLNHNAVTNTIYNEIAIVVSENSEYIISVLCNNGKMATSADTVSKISDYVYNALEK